MKYVYNVYVELIDNLLTGFDGKPTKFMREFKQFTNKQSALNYRDKLMKEHENVIVKEVELKRNFNPMHY